MSSDRRHFTEAELTLARNLLEDRVGYYQTAKTIGCSRDAIERRFPGYALTPSEIVEHQRLGRMESRLKTKTPQ